MARFRLGLKWSCKVVVAAEQEAARLQARRPLETRLASKHRGPPVRRRRLFWRMVAALERRAILEMPQVERHPAAISAFKVVMVVCRRLERDNSAVPEALVFLVARHQSIRSIRVVRQTLVSLLNPILDPVAPAHLPERVRIAEAVAPLGDIVAKP